MPKLPILILSFSILLGGFVFAFKDTRIEDFGRSPASLESPYSDESFIDAVISSRKVNKIVNSFIETSNSLFFMNSQSYLCFELGKSELAMKNLRDLSSQYSKTWPVGQRESIKGFIKKYPKGFSSICKSKNTKKKKTFLMQMGQSAREVHGNVYLDKHYMRNHREFYSSLEDSIEKKHEGIIYKELNQFITNIKRTNLKKLSNKKLTDACYELGKFVLPYYILNTSYLGSSSKRNVTVINNYAELGRTLKSFGPLCHGKKSKISRNLANVHEKADKLKKVIK